MDEEQAVVRCPHCGADTTGKDYTWTVRVARWSDECYGTREDGPGDVHMIDNDEEGEYVGFLYDERTVWCGACGVLIADKTIREALLDRAGLAEID